VPVNPPSLIGTPTVGSQLSCINGGFLNAPKKLAYSWLRGGSAIAGATSATYTLTSDDLGRSVACRITATNDAGSGDATSASVTVSNPAEAPAAKAPAAVAAPFSAAPAAPIAAPAPAPVVTTKAGVAFAAVCSLAKNRKSISCRVSSNTKAKIRGTIRLQGHKTASASKSGKKRVTLRVRSHRKLKKGTKVVLKLKSGKTTKQLTVKAR
jgi:hypothetical protein